MPKIGALMAGKQKPILGDLLVDLTAASDTFHLTLQITITIRGRLYISSANNSVCARFNWVVLQLLVIHVLLRYRTLRLKLSLFRC